MRVTSKGIPAEILLLWAMFLVVCTEILVAYIHIRPNELIGQPHTGTAVAVADAIGFLAFPTGLVAIGMTIVIGDRLTRMGRWVAAAAALALAVALLLPEAIDTEDVETVLNPQRAAGAAAVAVVGLLTALAVRRHGVRGLGPRIPWDGVRIGVIVAILIAALPWICADLRLSLHGVPVLRHVFLTSELRGEPGRPGLNPAVHHGHHHGMDGALLAISAVVLSRLIGGLPGWRRRALGWFCGMVFVYGIANALQDFWLEQIVKRGWSDTVLPKVLYLRPSPAFGVIVLCGAAVALLLLLVSPPPGGGRGGMLVSRRGSGSGGREHAA